MPDWFCLHNDAIYCPLCKGTLASSKHVTNHRRSGQNAYQMIDTSTEI